MDPLTHTLTGAALAETSLTRQADGGKIPLATATLLLGANLPDVDVLGYLRGADFALEHRRGWTHGVLAMVVLPLLLTLAVLAWDRVVRRRQDPHQPPAPPGTILALSYLAVLTHPALDWLNTYGVRLLMPFDGRWFYGDAVFILDPWMWLVLGSGVVLARSPLGRREATLWSALAVLTTAILAWGGPSPASTAGVVAWALWIGGVGATAAVARRRRNPPGSPHAATAALLLVAVYCLGMTLSTTLARHWVTETLTGRGVELARQGYRPGDAYRLMVGPVPVTPFRRQVVATTPDAYWTGTLRWTGEPRLEPEDLLPRPEPGSRIEAAFDDPEAQGFVTWVRFPWIAEGRDDALYLLDARYTSRPTTGFGGTRVAIPKK